MSLLLPQLPQLLLQKPLCPQPLLQQLLLPQLPQQHMLQPQSPHQPLPQLLLPQLLPLLQLLLL